MNGIESIYNIKRKGYKKVPIIFNNYSIDTLKGRKMFYVNDFQASRNIFFFANEKPFDILVSKKEVDKKVSPYSLVVAAKPLIYFASIFGAKLVSYEKNYIVSTNFFYKFYALFVIIAHIVLSTVVITPRSWFDTKSDVPLNILTKTFSTFINIEVLYLVFCIAVFNTKHYVELFNKFDNIDSYFSMSKSVFRRRRLVSIILVMLPIVQVSSSCCLRKFHWQNIGAHINFFLIMLQGSILYFVVVNIYLRIVMLNTLLLRAVKNTMSKEKKIIFQDTICDFIIKVSNA